MERDVADETIQVLPMLLRWRVKIAAPLTFLEIANLMLFYPPGCKANHCVVVPLQIRRAKCGSDKRCSP